MSKTEMEKWLRNEFNNGYVLQGWIIANLGKVFSQNINYNQAVNTIIFELVERAVSCGYMHKFETAIKNQIN